MTKQTQEKSYKFSENFSEIEKRWTNSKKTRINLYIDDFILDYFKEHQYLGSYQRAICYALGQFVMSKEHFKAFHEHELSRLLSIYAMRLNEYITEELETATDFHEELETAKKLSEDIEDTD